MISKTFQEADGSCEYLIDSMPIEVCANYRSYRCKLKGKEFIGFCKAKKKFYYGFKLHLIASAQGKPIEFLITPASTSDVTALKMIKIDLDPNSTIYGDKAYNDYSFEDLMHEICGIQLIPDLHHSTLAFQSVASCDSPKDYLWLHRKLHHLEKLKLNVAEFREQVGF